MFRFSSTGKLVGGHQAAVMCLAVAKMSETEDCVVTGSKDHYIKVFEVSGIAGGVFSPKMTLDPPHYDGIQTLALQGDILFSGSRDMCIKKWDLSRQELVQVLRKKSKFPLFPKVNFFFYSPLITRMRTGSVDWNFYPVANAWCLAVEVAF